jgi:hypothetical protein
LQLKIRWQGGATDVVELQLPANRPDAIRYTATVIDRVRDLGRGHDDEDIAALFNGDALRSSTGKSFTASMIAGSASSVVSRPPAATRNAQRQ